MRVLQPGVIIGQSLCGRLWRLPTRAQRLEDDGRPPGPQHTLHLGQRPANLGAPALLIPGDTVAEAPPGQHQVGHAIGQRQRAIVGHLDGPVVQSQGCQSGGGHVQHRLRNIERPERIDPRGQEAGQPARTGPHLDHVQPGQRADPVECRQNLMPVVLAGDQEVILISMMLIDILKVYHRVVH